jgi:hypothetical protein
VSELGEIIHPFGRAERVVERELIRDPETGLPLYYALRSEPLEAEPSTDAGQ